MLDFALSMTGSKTLMSFIVATNVLLFALTLSLFITLLFHKLYVERRSRRLALLKERYLSDVTSRFYEPDLVVTPPSTPLEYEALGSVFATVLVNVTGEMAENVRRSIREVGIDVHYRKMVWSRSWVRRFAAVEKLGYLRFPELRPVFAGLLEQEKDARIIPKAVWALSLIAEPDDLQVINRVLRDPLFMSSKFSEFIYTNIIRAFREREQDDLLVGLLLELMDDTGPPVMLKRDIIQACGSEQFYPARDLVADCFRRFHDLPEMRIACIRTLQRFSAIDTEGLLDECLRDPDWRIRGVAAKSAHIYSTRMVEPLRRLLYDESYHVRINSALSLAKMGEAGLDVLVGETRSNDHFVRDVSQYVLKRLIYAS